MHRRMYPGGRRVVLFILAGNDGEARRFAQDNGLRQRDYLYLACGAVLHGYPDAVVVRTGTWEKRTDLHTLNILFRARGVIES